MEKNDKSQAQKFKDAARELHADESEEAFERALRKIVKPPLKKDAPKDDR